MGKISLVIDEDYMEHMHVLWRNNEGLVCQNTLDLAVKIVELDNDTKIKYYIYMVSLLDYNNSGYNLIMGTNEYDVIGIFYDYMGMKNFTTDTNPKVIGRLRTAREEYDVTYALEAMKLREEYNE